MSKQHLKEMSYVFDQMIAGQSMGRLLLHQQEPCLYI